VRLFELRPDWLGVKVLAGLRSFGDDAALRAIADALEREGVRVVSPTAAGSGSDSAGRAAGAKTPHRRAAADADVVSAWLAPSARSTSARRWVVKRGVVLAVEAVEGTDACIARGGRWPRRGWW